MAALLFLLFVVVPIVEISVFVWVAAMIGVLPALAALLGLSLLGVWLVKREGVGVLRRMQSTVNRGEVPTAEMVDGALLAGAGLLCVVPGFVTGVVGLLLVVPPVRALVRGRLLARWGRGAGLGRSQRFVAGRIVDVEYVGDVTPSRSDRRPPTELGPSR